MTGQKVEDISQLACENLKDKNNASVISLSDSEDDIGVLSNTQSPSCSISKNSRQEKKSETLQQTTDSRAIEFSYNNDPAKAQQALFALPSYLRRSN